MAKYLIVTDVDGTLAVDHQHVSPKTSAILRQLMAAGHEFYLATGRMYALAKMIAEQVAETAEIIASDGAVYDFNGERVHHLLGKDAIRESLVESEARGLAAIYFSDDALYFTHLPKQLVEEGLANFMPQGAKIAVREMADVPALLAHEDEITNGIVLSATDEEPIDAARKALEAKDLLHISASTPTNLELIPQHIDKAVALKELQAKTGIPASRTIVFGDGKNDMGMMQGADVSVAMGNAVPEVKAIARYETRSNTEDGIAYFLERFFK